MQHPKASAVEAVMPPDDLDQHRQQIIEQIHAAFDGVSRHGGVSWSEAGVIDDNGSEEECRRARESDTDRSWTELVDSRAWDPEDSDGSFAFLDAIGLGYYLPAAMVRCVRAEYDAAGLAFALTLTHKHYAGAHKSTLENWSLLDDEQRACVAAFLRHMIRVCEEQGFDDDARPWQEALDSYWRQIG